MTYLWISFPTITSPALSEVVLELGGTATSRLTRTPLSHWGWGRMDELFEGFLDRCPDFKLVIRIARPLDCDENQVRVRRFPLMRGRDRIKFETSLVADKYGLP